MICFKLAIARWQYDLGLGCRQNTKILNQAVLEIVKNQCQRSFP